LVDGDGAGGSAATVVVGSAGESFAEGDCSGGSVPAVVADSAGGLFAEDCAGGSTVAGGIGVAVGVVVRGAVTGAGVDPAEATWVVVISGAS
jgi:hypothetical protein